MTADARSAAEAAGGTAPTMHAPTATPMRERPPSMARLIAIETRKAVDTRSGRWLLAIVVLIAVGVMLLITLAGHATNHRFQDVNGGTSGFVSFLLPVVGILLVTSEWSQRTAMVTFALVPRRGRIIWAKLVAGVVIAVVMGLLTAAIAAIGAAVGSHPAGATDTWHSFVQAVLLSLLFQVLGMLGGMAFGLLFLNSAIAIVLSYVVTLAWTILANAVSALNGVRNWLDTGTTYGYLLNNDMSTRHWEQVATSAGFWVVLLTVLGLIRLSLKEIS
ncbi:MAG: hypothetical protein ACR2JQ_10400 [Mycobacteriales bacterium]